MPRWARTRNVSAAQARSYLAKAEEYPAASESELEAKRSIARRAWLSTLPSTPPMQPVAFVSASEQPVRTMIGQANC